MDKIISSHVYAPSIDTASSGSLLSQKARGGELRGKKSSEAASSGSASSGFSASSDAAVNANQVSAHDSTRTLWQDVTTVFVAYFRLCKPRVTLLVSVTALVAIAVLWRSSIDQSSLYAGWGDILIDRWPALLLTLFCITLATGASGALNMAWDADIDAVMIRTKDRPIPLKVIDRGNAAVFGILLTAFSVALLGISLSWVAALLLLFAAVIYVGVYTLWLKRRSTLNIVIGGAAGALPPVVAWVAMGGDVMDLRPWLLFAIVFVWTPAHFWALAILRMSEYAKVGVPMLPCVRGVRHTTIQIMVYAAVTLTLSWMAMALPLGGNIYFVIAMLCGLIFFRSCVRLWLVASRVDVIGQDILKKTAQRCFLYSIAYLSLLMMGLFIDRIVVY